jgi:hypothetical protein
VRETDFNEIWKVLCKVLSRFSAAGRAILVSYYANFYPLVRALPCLVSKTFIVLNGWISHMCVYHQERLERLVTALQQYLAVQWILRADRADLNATLSTVGSVVFCLVSRCMRVVEFSHRWPSCTKPTRSRRS